MGNTIAKQKTRWLSALTSGFQNGHPAPIGGLLLLSDIPVLLLEPSLPIDGTSTARLPAMADLLGAPRFTFTVWKSLT